MTELCDWTPWLAGWSARPVGTAAPALESRTGLGLQTWCYGVYVIILGCFQPTANKRKLWKGTLSPPLQSPTLPQKLLLRAREPLGMACSVAHATEGERESVRTRQRLLACAEPSLCRVPPPAFDIPLAALHATCCIPITPTSGPQEQLFGGHKGLQQGKEAKHLQWYGNNTPPSRYLIWYFALE